MEGASETTRPHPDSLLELLLEHLPGSLHEPALLWSLRPAGVGRSVPGHPILLLDLLEIASVEASDEFAASFVTTASFVLTSLEELGWQAHSNPPHPGWRRCRTCFHTSVHTISPLWPAGGRASCAAICDWLRPPKYARTSTGRCSSGSPRARGRTDTRPGAPVSARCYRPTDTRTLWYPLDPDGKLGACCAL